MEFTKNQYIYYMSSDRLIPARIIKVCSKMLKVVGDFEEGTKSKYVKKDNCVDQIQYNEDIMF